MKTFSLFVLPFLSLSLHAAAVSPIAQDRSPQVSLSLMEGVVGGINSLPTLDNPLQALIPNSPAARYFNVAWDEQDPVAVSGVFVSEIHFDGSHLVAVPEASEIWGALAFGGIAGAGFLRRRRKQAQ